MKTYKEMADEVFQQGDERIKSTKTKKKKATAVILTVFAVAIVIAVWKNQIPKIPPVSDNSITESHSNTTELTVKDITGADHEITTAHIAEKVDKESFGGTEGACIPVFPQKDGIKYTGEHLTDAEAKEYFEQNKVSIISALSSSGVSTGNYTIKNKGYSHASYSGVENEQLTVNRGFRDYLVYNGNDIIAIVTLYKENGKIYNSPAFGGAWFKDYANYLNQHKGEELLFVYVGQTEIIVAPDGSCKNPLGYNCSQYFEGVKNLYSRLYCPEIVYVP